MAWAQTDLDVVEKAIAGAEMTVRYADGREVTYRSVTELLKARDAIKDSLAGGAGGVRCTYAKFVKD